MVPKEELTAAGAKDGWVLLEYEQLPDTKITTVLFQRTIDDPGLPSPAFLDTFK